MTPYPSASQGFTLIELMIVIAIIGVLGSIAVPQYMDYTKKAKFSEVTAAAAPVKSAIGICLQTENQASACDTWEKIGIDPNQITGTDTVAEADLQATPLLLKITSSEALNSFTYILTPSLDPVSNSLSWSVSGTCMENGRRYC